MSGSENRPKASPEPDFASEDEARTALIDTARAMNRSGINQGKSGNVSLRWARSGADGFLVTPSALPHEETEVDDVVWAKLNHALNLPDVFDGHRKPSSEWRFHHDILLRRPEVRCVLHTHGIDSTALACRADVQAQGIPAFHYRVSVAGGDSIRCAPYATFGTQALSEHALVALDGRRACLLANHGLIATGASLADALALAGEVEALARMYLRLLPPADIVILGDEAMREVRERFATYRP